jgi:hypothetical protein
MIACYVELGMVFGACVHCDVGLVIEMDGGEEE